MKTERLTFFLLLAASALSLLIFGAAAGSDKKQDPGVVTLSEFSKKTGDTTKNVLVYFSASWCNICTKMKPIVQQLESENPPYEIVRIDTDRDKEVAKEFEVTSLPIFILYKKGVRQWIHVGYIDKTQLKVKAEAW
jgi:thioredoxin 1